MSMNFKDLNEIKSSFRTDYSTAVESGDKEAMEKAFEQYAEEVCSAMLADAQSLSAEQKNDDIVLAQRGIRVLSSNEKKYYNALINAMKSKPADIQSALTNIDVVMPEETVDQVMQDVRTQFPLLDAIDFVNSSYLTHYLFNAQGIQTATWGTIGGDVKGQLGGAFRKIDATICKLTCYMAVSMDFLQLGPRWLDSYVRAVLVEAMGNAMETAIVSGVGNANSAPAPIGMMADLDTGSTSESTGLTTYTLKTAKAVTDFSPDTYGALLAELAKTPTGRDRTIGEVILVCNPTDYYKKIMPATTFLNPQGAYVQNVLPFPTKVIPSVGCPENYAVLGIAKQYLGMLGTGSAKQGVISYDDSVQFLNDNRVYKARFLGNGRPKDNVSFLRLDITNLKPVYFSVKEIS